MKFVCNMKDVEALKNQFAEAEAKVDELTQRAQFLKDAEKKLFADAEAHKKDHWEKMEAILLQNNLVPGDFKKSNDGIHIDEDHNVFLASEQELVSIMVGRMAKGKLSEKELAVVTDELIKEISEKDEPPTTLH